MTWRGNVPLVLSAVALQSKCSNEDRPDCKGAFKRMCWVSDIKQYFVNPPPHEAAGGNAKGGIMIREQRKANGGDQADALLKSSGDILPGRMPLNPTTRLGQLSPSTTITSFVETDKDS
ncbi:hypothetical protein ARMSODRAFT_983874 [Armillaria solidipes]|uniref:Uncharacterized protein n=1 Tax=Armillaria solidipes TaxID=1076256 RepID=A0A2H3AHE7_9AGAR|nr:hypothetical protein ARMSODRAFT_983874 [Armillaria solidipes]